MQITTTGPLSQNENARRQPGIGQNKNNGAILSGQPAAVKVFNYPDPASVKGRTLGAFLRGQRITHLDCWKRFGSARLSHHVYILRGTGWPVQMVEQTVTTSDAGRSATIGVYFLDPEVIVFAGEPGQSYAEHCARIEAERRSS
ncbi:MAG TPA: hypothetical protein VFF41_03085 [Gallionella sp.]|nr:hypothetical protein [Gallionella sp.]